MRIASRQEDMSVAGRLVVVHCGDGDVCVQVVESDHSGEILGIAAVEFCILGVGDGSSPRTHAALVALRLARMPIVKPTTVASLRPLTQSWSARWSVS